MTEVICDRCEERYDNRLLNNCPICNSVMKRPNWEKDKKWITKNLYVASTLKWGSKTKYIPVISNFYFDSDEDKMKRNKIKFKTPEQMKKVLSGLNYILSKLNWKSRVEYLEEVKKEKEEEVKVSKNVAELMEKYPSTILNVLENFDPSSLSDDTNLSLTKDVIKNLNQTMFRTEESVKAAFKNVLKRLTKQDKQAMDELASLLDTSSLLEITSVSRILMSRLTTLEMFEDMILNEKTYEIRGENSVQSKLENNMWILNEEWWLVQANRSLKKFIGDEIKKKAGRRRPDFVCVSFEGKLIIVDIKKPSHSIGKSDIDQVEEYKLIVQEYKGQNYRSIQCYVVGKKIPQKAKRIARERRNINLLTYTELTENVRKKYIEYLKALKDAREKEKKQNE